MFSFNNLKPDDQLVHPFMAKILSFEHDEQHMQRMRFKGQKINGGKESVCVRPNTC